MRCGQCLITRSSLPPPLPSLLRSSACIVRFYYFPSPAYNSMWIKSSSFPPDERIAFWKQPRSARSKIPAPLPLSILAGSCLRNFCTPQASQASNSSASMDSNTMKSMENKIKEKLNADVVIVKDAYGDGRHVSIEVVSAAFEGQSAVNRQRMVYKAIWEELQSTVHAVDHMATRTPAEASKNQ